MPIGFSIEVIFGSPPKSATFATSCIPWFINRGDDRSLRMSDCIIPSTYPSKSVIEPGGRAPVLTPFLRHRIHSVGAIDKRTPAGEGTEANSAIIATFLTKILDLDISYTKTSSRLKHAIQIPIKHFEIKHP